MSLLLTILDEFFRCQHQKGWLALRAKPDLPMHKYRTRRIGKLTPAGELQFTIGATLAGQDSRLNEFIWGILEAEGVEVLTRASTSGSRDYLATYPTIDTKVVDPTVVRRIIKRRTKFSRLGSTAIRAVGRCSSMPKPALSAVGTSREVNRAGVASHSSGAAEAICERLQQGGSWLSLAEATGQKGPRVDK